MPAASVLAVLSFGVLAFPVIGGVTRNGPLFLGGGLIAPIVGMVLAGTGLKLGRGSGAGTACGFALAINIIVVAFFALGILNMIM